MSRPPSGPSGLAWVWPDALPAVVYALPAGVVASRNPSAGLALAVGVLPASITGLPPVRQARRVIAVAGTMVGLSMFIGACIAQIPALAVGGLVACAVGAAWLAGRTPVGMLLLTLCVPLVGVGFSFHDDIRKAATAGALMAAGSVFAWLVSLLWPERPPASAPPPPQAPVTLWYGFRLGLAGATAAAIGFVLDLGHVGWATAAALLVMRPSHEMLRIRSVGRLASVTLGALGGIALVSAEPPALAYSAAIIVALASAAATHTSRWYVTSAFTTFLVFLLLLHSDPAQAQHRFDERVAETILGVASACFFGLVVPVLRARMRSVDATARVEVDGS